MSMQRMRSGHAGEDYAAAFLAKRGYRILERNFKNILGEIDIVADHKGTLCFIEVKTRTSDGFGSPFEAVTRPKQRKLARVAESYLKYKRMTGRKARFDVVAVMLGQEGCASIQIVPDAFEIL
ncbi:MAG: YraN family protein [Omnitrophica WOR_2 bacterium RIFCSPHIGHO2_02_FULL_52_10]|nr:MAG: YraN family protein [Omnitrophica WOR_2 bacterium RIFCSPHIGHO2_02_FULL_52_10]